MGEEWRGTAGRWPREREAERHERLLRLGLGKRRREEYREKEMMAKSERMRENEKGVAFIAR